MYKIGFIGCGKMGGAILSAFLKNGVGADDVLVCDAREETLAAYRKMKIAVTDSPADVAACCRTVFLAVKPQDFDALVSGIAHRLGPSKLVVSIAAGKTLARIRELAGPGPRLVRVMPNLPVLVGEGMVAYAPDTSAKPADVKLVAKLLGSCGTAIQLEERHFDAVTALSGSGPAFFAYVMEAMAAAGEKLGLPADAARLLSNKTMLGTARYLAETGQDPQAFIRAVCSPKGTTEAGMKKLEASSTAAALEKTLAAAAKRSAELK
ncbi:MAG: pyrroline-5-carboxylate reductase [Kiritimatiellae bacterium]|nr:pyrroline-5-carboxylate reductase [Kiritimatiellia bacterium]